ncbi:MarR family winged helix-turn-helix transcriptional regulator [Kribbella kalugense]|uniref:DNA-binding MarR family transcriptional regulator n=1 Tax=Kribbella kalugense TaxID=2512221 RepID=A0A4R8A0S1_9ACTN|nr:MarR family transcriptional regulator [Kribbella kalugense]TDW21660.1 DNA-binding MarR family transcriptional regulator [Kribbella kalugense]
MKDFVDAHIELWAGELDHLDRDVEGITVRLQVLTRYLDRRREAVLAAYGLQSWEFKTLHMLRRGGTPYRATPGELARQLGMSAAALTNRIDALVRRGYVERTQDRDDRRKVVATLTPAGRELWERGIGDIQRVEEELIHHLSAGDRTRLDDLLRSLVLVTEKDS